MYVNFPGTLRRAFFEITTSGKSEEKWGIRGNPNAQGEYSLTELMESTWLPGNLQESIIEHLA
ncbi:hypothetical protein CSB45_04140 [candidate division KSB3 bacterium]|uniref:Uncharacterized protein n=1 Tax=candidate division KSB3 bacterium TaxID=2044937 RepID=A0A2G6E899_9BACT|nr:MAG: hypothetical protein CSB45_04140 [candidate division KSB3 bacterium]PIE30569.1 MAG: hypothetical protein CSA57_02725 [candidate division KSB3 bacterium]